jgi:Fe2+ transport system protein FeoA
MQLRRRQKHSMKQEPCLDSEGMVPLTCVKEGAKAVMTHSSGNVNVVRRLSEMGLTPGCELQMIRKCSFHGPIEIEVRGAALALGYELASEIFVQELKANSDAN